MATRRSGGKRLRMDRDDDDEENDDHSDGDKGGFDPAEFYRQQQQQMLLQASQHVKETKEEIQRAQAMAEETGKRARRSAAAAANVALSCMTEAEEQLDNRLFGRGRTPAAPSAPTTTRDDALFQTPLAPAPRAPRGRPPGSGGGSGTPGGSRPRGRPVGSVRGAGTNRPRGRGAARPPRRKADIQLL